MLCCEGVVLASLLVKRCVVLSCHRSALCSYFLVFVSLLLNNLIIFFPQASPLPQSAKKNPFSWLINNTQFHHDTL